MSSNQPENLTDSPDAAQYRAEVRRTLLERILGWLGALAWWR